MNSRSTMTYAVVAAAAATLALAGCNGGEERPTAGPGKPTSASPSSSSAGPTSPTPSPSPTASASAVDTVPAAARANSDAGAIAFVQFWFEQLNVAYTKPDAGLIPANSTIECKSCATVQKDPAAFVTQGHRMIPKPIAGLSSLKVLEAPGDRKVVRFTIKQNATRVLDSNGAIIDTQKAGTGQQLAILVWKGDRWFMNGVADAA